MKRTIEEERKFMVRFKFKKINYYRIKRDTGEEIGEAQGEMSLRLFKSWFTMMKSTGRLLCGVLEIVESGDMWIWQPPVETSRGWMGGWQKALDGKYRKSESDGLNVHETYAERLGIGNDIAERMRS